MWLTTGIFKLDWKHIQITINSHPNNVQIIQAIIFVNSGAPVWNAQSMFVYKVYSNYIHSTFKLQSNYIQTTFKICKLYSRIDCHENNNRF